MSELAALLLTLREARAERVFFAPGEVGQAFDGLESRPLRGGPVSASTLLAAVSELLSQDEVRALPSNRPRIVRHEHDGADYVLEVVRQPGGVALGVRHAKTTLRRDPLAADGARDSFRDSVREEPREAVEPREPEPLVSAPKEEEAPQSLPRGAVVSARADEPVRRSSRRFRAPRGEKHTIRVEVDEEGVPLDATAIDLDPSMPGVPNEPPKPPRRSSKAFTRPALPAAAPAAPVPALSPVPVGGRIYETRIIPRAGQPATNTEIAGSPSGAYVTFLFAPSGFSLVIEGEGAVVIAKTDDAAVRGEIYVGPNMKLRVAQGPKESVVTFYRRQPAP